MPYRSHISVAQKLRCALIAAICVALLAFAATKLAAAVVHGVIAVHIRGADFTVDASARPVAFALFFALWLCVALGTIFGAYAAARKVLSR